MEILRCPTNPKKRGGQQIHKKELDNKTSSGLPRKITRGNTKMQEGSILDFDYGTQAAKQANAICSIGGMF